MRLSLVLASALAILPLTVADVAMAGASPRAGLQSRAFFESVEFGDTVEIVRNGPISIEAKCEGNLEIEPGIFIDRIRLLAVTTVPGTAAQLESGFLPNNVGVFLNPSTSELSRRFADVERSAGNPTYQNERDDGSVVAPSGEVIQIDGETLGLRLNIFDVDCLVVGTYQVFDGRF